MIAARNLCFHYVTRTRGERRLAVSLAELRTLVERERSEGRNPISLSSYVNPMTTRVEGSDHFSVSFDDAHRSVLDLAAPVLADLAIPATLFVPAAWIGSGGEWLDWHDLEELRRLGWTIGSHSLTHPRMSWSLNGERAASYAARLRDECVRSREVLSERLGTDVTLFAYPYGEDPEAARAAVKEAGYGAAFTVRESREWDGDVFSIPRLEAMEAHGLVQAAGSDPIGISVVVPARDRVPILREVLGRLAAQTYPRDRYEVLVVDDGSTEDLTSTLPSDPSHSDPSPFRVIGSRADRVSSSSTPRPFRAGQARGLGASQANHEIVAFLDADVAVGRDYLWALDWVHRRFPRTALLGYLSGYNLHDLGLLHTLEQIAGVEPLESVPVILDRQREPTARATLDNVDWLEEPWRLCYTGNLSLPRALFDEIGGFSDAFEGWGLEDVDLGVRLHHAGARFVFSRFALGYHLVDPSEPAPRNPFRRSQPTRDDFAAYVKNLHVLRARHGDDPAMSRYAERTLADIDETCSRPHTVGIEFGGAASVRPPFHHELHRLQPGGVPTEELLDRVAYAAKIGARRLWLQGGEPAEHEGFLRVLESAAGHGLKSGLLTMAHPFADARLAREARKLGLDHATILVLGGDADRHEHWCGEATFARFALGVEALREAGVHRSARLVVRPGDEATMHECEKRLRDAGVEIEE